MSSRLSPFDTATLYSWPSLSMKVTQSSSPGLGGSTWPCRVDGVEENDRTDSEGAGRIYRGEAREVGEEMRALDIVTGAVLVLPNRRRYCGEGVCAEEGRRRVKARANVRGAAMAAGEWMWGGRGRRGGGRRDTQPGGEVLGDLRLDIGLGVVELQLAVLRSASPTGAAYRGLEAANAQVYEDWPVQAMRWGGV